MTGFDHNTHKAKVVLYPVSMCGHDVSTRTVANASLRSHTSPLILLGCCTQKTLCWEEHFILHGWAPDPVCQLKDVCVRVRARHSCQAALPVPLGLGLQVP